MNNYTRQLIRREEANLSRQYTLTINRLPLAMDGSAEWQLTRIDVDLNRLTHRWTTLPIPETHDHKIAMELVRDLWPEVAVFGSWGHSPMTDGFYEYETEVVYA